METTQVSDRSSGKVAAGIGVLATGILSLLAALVVVFDGSLLHWTLVAVYSYTVGVGGDMLFQGMGIGPTPKLREVGAQLVSVGLVIGALSLLVSLLLMEFAGLFRATVGLVAALTLIPAGLVLNEKGTTAEPDESPVKRGIDNPSQLLTFRLPGKATYVPPCTAPSGTPFRSQQSLGSSRGRRSDRPTAN